MKPDNSLPILSFETHADWEAWLEENHATAKGLWFKIAKKGSGITTLDHAQALESALCFGWIDGQGGKFDDQFWLQKFTPRRPKSIWSKINVDKVQALIAEGRMRPAGLRQVELAQADGRWAAAYDSPSRISVPDDLQAELDANPEAFAFFNALNATNRYAILFRIHNAKRPETRAARIKKFIDMLIRHEKIYP
jgi:uncharacterized protein YdeI (YjbR/CyaY-like superfamily)